MNIKIPTNDWSLESWKGYPRVQQPIWSDEDKLQKICERLSELPPLVFAGEVKKLRKELVKVEENKGFVLQFGDCAETFSQCKSEIIRENLKILLQMSIILTFSGGKHVVKIGRCAGQYAKPRTSDFEEVNGVKYPSYRGDMVNSEALDFELRKPDPRRILDSYFHSTATLNLLRGFTSGGYAGLENVHKWNKEYIKDSPQGKRYEVLAKQIDKNLAFIKAVGIKYENTQHLQKVELYTSHEALILEYEQALTRQDSLTGITYDCSAHLLWIGKRTRQSEGAHVEFLRGVQNPIGIKLDENVDLEDLKRAIIKLNPNNEQGKILLISRYGIEYVNRDFPSLVKEFNKEGFNLSYVCDPMHGNTSNVGKYKTRKFEDILKEIVLTNQILKSESRHLGGIHIEATGQNVTECIGGSQQLDDKSLEINYTTSCDPRLNASQSVELSFLLAEHLL